MDDRKTSGNLLVFFEENYARIIACSGELCYFSKGILVSVPVGGAGNVYSIWEEGCKKIGFSVKSRIERSGEEDFGFRWRSVGEESREFEGKGGGCKVEVGTRC